MRRLRDLSLVVPDDFRYTDPDTGVKTEAKGYQTWVDTVKERRRINGLPIPIDLEARMQEQLCGVIPPEYCDRDPGDVSTWIDLNFSWSDFREGMAIFTDWAEQGVPLVEQEEANRRAAICVSCPCNVNVRGCTTCHKIASYLTGAVAKTKTAYDDSLRACAVCRCALKAMVFFPSDILTRHESPERQALRPEFCWAKQSSSNYFEKST